MQAYFLYCSQSKHYSPFWINMQMIPLTDSSLLVSPQDFKTTTNAASNFDVKLKLNPQPRPHQYKNWFVRCNFFKELLRPKFFFKWTDSSNFYNYKEIQKLLDANMIHDFKANLISVRFPYLARFFFERYLLRDDYLVVQSPFTFFDWIVNF